MNRTVEKNIENIARISISFLFCFTIWLCIIWFMGVGLAALIVLTNRFNLIYSEMSIVGMLVGLLTMLIPLLFGLWFSLVNMFKIIKNGVDLNERKSK